MLGDRWQIHAGKEQDFLTCSPECRRAGGYPERAPWPAKTSPTSAGLSSNPAASADAQETLSLTTGLAQAQDSQPTTMKPCPSAGDATKTSTTCVESSGAGLSSSDETGSDEWWQI